VPQVLDKRDLDVEVRWVGLEGVCDMK
jgi:hypothetical protein